MMKTQDDFEHFRITQNYMNELIAEAREDAKKAYADAMMEMDGVKEEYAEAVKQWGRMDGSRPTDDLKILQEFKLSAEKFDDLASRYQENYPMMRKLQEYWKERSDEIIAANRKKEGFLSVSQEKVKINTRFESPSEKIPSLINMWNV